MAIALCEKKSEAFSTQNEVGQCYYALTLSIVLENADKLRVQLQDETETMPWKRDEVPIQLDKA